VRLFVLRDHGRFAPVPVALPPPVCPRHASHAHNRHRASVLPEAEDLGAAISRTGELRDALEGLQHLAYVAMAVVVDQLWGLYVCREGDGEGER
jgi:hypothetical protein